MVGKIVKKIIALIALLLVVVTANATIVSGIVKSKEKPLSEVLVTDGFTFTVTDNKGFYSFDTDKKTEFIYLVTPKGYVADFSSGCPQFYQKYEESKTTYNFSLEKMKSSGSINDYVMITMADTQLDTDNDKYRLEKETLPDIKKMINDNKDTQTAGIILGDITWDVYKHNMTIKEFAKQLSIPIYPVIGNHDFDKYIKPSKDVDFAHIYKKNFGPLYYAFQLGNAYYIVLNNIEYYGNKRYKVTLENENQMKWLSLLLNSVIQQDNKIFIAMHAPIRSYNNSLIPGGEDLKKMIINKFQATIISGHYHANSKYYIGENLMEHNIGAVCGSFWNSGFCSDGTPNGYQVFQSKDSKTNWYYKATGFDKNVQFITYKKGSIMERPKSIVVKVWNWDEQWRVRWYEDNKFMGDMNQFFSFDPDYLSFLNGRRAVDDYAPLRTNHYFSFIPSNKTKEIKIEVVDRFGKIYQQIIENK